MLVISNKSPPSIWKANAGHLILKSQVWWQPSCHVQRRDEDWQYWTSCLCVYETARHEGSLGSKVRLSLKRNCNCVTVMFSDPPADVPRNLVIHCDETGAHLQSHEHDVICMVKRDAADKYLCQDRHINFCTEADFCKISTINGLHSTKGLISCFSVDLPSHPVQ